VVRSVCLAARAINNIEPHLNLYAVKQATLVNVQQLEQRLELGALLILPLGLGVARAAGGALVRVLLLLFMQLVEEILVEKVSLTTA
jgi:hypothetical protein